jgi:hypothetical protein
MKTFKILILIILIASVASVRTSRNGIIHNNDHVALIVNDTVVANTSQPNLQVRRVKFCDKCHLDTHYDITSVKCPFNENFVGATNKVCNSCFEPGHCNKRYRLCKNNIRNKTLQDLLNEDESHQRKCNDCGGEDHVNINSNLCKNNMNGIHAPKKSDSHVIPHSSNSNLFLNFI